MNLAEKPHQAADSAVSSVHRRSAIFRIRKPFLNKFITASREQSPQDRELPRTPQAVEKVVVGAAGGPKEPENKAKTLQ